MIKPLGRVLRLWLILSTGLLFFMKGYAQDTTDIHHIPIPARIAMAIDTTRFDDSALRIKNLNPYFTLHVDSTLAYKFEINREPSKYFFLLENAPVGLKIRENGMLFFRAD